MNKFKRMVAVCAAVGMLWSAVYAQETRDLGYKVKIEEGQVTARMILYLILTTLILM